MARLGDYIEQIRGVSYKPEDVCDQNDSDAVAILRANNIQDDGLNFDDLIYVKNKKVSVNQYIKKGDIVVCASSGSKNLVGKASIAREDLDMSFGAFCKVIRAKSILPEYLGCYFQSPVYRKLISDLAGGANINNIRNEHIDDIEINIPDICEQKVISEKINKVLSLILCRKKQLSKFDELVKSRFVEMFGTLDNPAQEFKKATLKELCNKITDGKHGGCTQEEGTERYFVGAREIYDDKVHYDTAPEINVAEFEKDYKRCNIETGDFLIVNTGATIGKSAIATDLRTEHTLLQKSVALLKIKKALLNPVFLKWCYKVNTKMYMVESASAQPNLLLSKINATEIYVPDIELQNRFADFVKQTDKSKIEVKESLEKLETLKKALMQEYFDEKGQRGAHVPK